MAADEEPEQATLRSHRISAPNGVDLALEARSLAAQVMELCVYSLAGLELCRVQLNGSERAQELREMVHQATKIPVKLQKLLIGGEILQGQLVLELLEATGAHEIQLLRTDKWIEEVRQDWRRLRKASEGVKNDRELVLQAIEASEGHALRMAGPLARQDPEVVFTAMRFKPSLCRYALGSLQSDRESCREQRNGLEIDVWRPT